MHVTHRIVLRDQTNGLSRELGELVLTRCLIGFPPVLGFESKVSSRLIVNDLFIRELVPGAAGVLTGCLEISLCFLFTLSVHPGTQNQPSLQTLSVAHTST